MHVAFTKLNCGVTLYAAQNFSETGGDRFQLRCFYFISGVSSLGLARMADYSRCIKERKMYFMLNLWSGASVLAECSPVVILKVLDLLTAHQ